MINEINKVRKVEPIYKSKKTTERNKEERRKFLQDQYLVKNKYKTSKSYSKKVLQHERPFKKILGDKGGPWARKGQP